MAVVDVGAVERDDAVHLLFHGFPDGLDAHHGEDLDDVVGVCSDRVDRLLRQHAHQSRSVRLQDPLLMSLRAGGWRMVRVWMWCGLLLLWEL